MELNAMVFSTEGGVLPMAHVAFLNSDGSIDYDRPGAVAEQDGGFILDAEPGDKIQISFVGFHSQKIGLTSDSFSELQHYKIKPNTNVLGEAVINGTIDDKPIWKDWRFWTAVAIIAIAAAVMIHYRNAS